MGAEPPYPQVLCKMCVLLVVVGGKSFYLGEISIIRVLYWGQRPQTPYYV